MNGQDFPLKTNLEMVRTLSSLKGRNSLESVELCDSNKWKVKKIHEIVNGAIQVCHLSSLCPDYCQTGINDRHPSNYDLFNCFRPQKRTRGRLHSTCPFGQEVSILWSAEATSAFARLVKWPRPRWPTGFTWGGLPWVSWYPCEGSLCVWCRRSTVDASTAPPFCQ